MVLERALKAPSIPFLVLVTSAVCVCERERESYKEKERKEREREKRDVRERREKRGIFTLSVLVWVKLSFDQREGED